MNKHNALEKRVVTVLTGNGGNLPSASELVELIRNTEAAMQAADATAANERAKSLDLVSCPDPRAAHEAVVESELIRDRLQASLPKLRNKLTEALAAEAKEKWGQDYRRVRQLRDDAAKNFQRIQALSEEIAGYLQEAERVDRDEVSRINSSAPDGEHRRLASVELHARNLTRFDRDNPSLASTIKLRDWNNSSRTLWPRRSGNTLAVEFASSMIAPPHHPCEYTSEWWKAAQAKAESAHVDSAQMADFYSEQTKSQEDRQNLEARQAFAASQKRVGTPSITRLIAGWLRFFTLIQCFDRPA
jgi:hypothetical protein